MPIPIVDIVLEDPRSDDLRGIVAPLDAYNDAHSGMADLPGFAIVRRDPETRKATGGLYATDGMAGPSSVTSPSRMSTAARALAAA